MKRTFVTSAEEDAALAWRVAKEAITEDAFIARVIGASLVELVATYREDEAQRIYAAYKAAPLADRSVVKVALKLDAP